MKKNYIIPYGERSTVIGEDAFWGKRTLMCVDNVGLIVEHNKKIVPTDDDVRRHLIGWNEQHRIFIQANSLQEALQEFYDYPECKTGTKHRAWELADSKQRPVIEYAACEHMCMAGGGTACGRYDKPSKDGWELCVLDGRDEPPTDCPIDAQMAGKGWRKEVVQVGGVWVKRYSTHLLPMDPQINNIRPRVV